MTKIILSSFLFLSFSAFACKPMGLATCRSRELMVDQKAFERLLIQVEDYQKFLDAHIKRPEHTTSCFNNHFAGFYGGEFKRELKQHSGHTCPANIKSVKSQFEHLVSENLEFRSLKETSKPEGEQKRMRLAKKIRKFFKPWN